MQETAITPTEQTETSNASYLVLILYLGLIATLEILGAFFGILTSMVGHALLVWVLINHASSSRHAPYGRALLALALLPLTRILSITMPLQQLPPVYWYLLISLPLFVGIYLVSKNLNVTIRDLKLTMVKPVDQILVALSGILIGLFGYLILKPDPLFKQPSAGEWFLSIIVLFASVAFLEEIIYRGLLLTLTSGMEKTFAIVFTSLLFTFMLAGSTSLAFAALMGLSGAFFAWWTLRYDTIWGAVFAHWVAVVGLLMVWPIVFR